MTTLPQFLRARLAEEPPTAATEETRQLLDAHLAARAAQDARPVEGRGLGLYEAAIQERAAAYAHHPEYEAARVRGF